MSDDEVSRRRAPALALVGLAGLLAVAWWIRGRALDEYKAFAAFCGASHPGEEWSHVQARAAEHGWSFQRHSREGQQPEEWLSEYDFWSYRAGCVVTLSKGRVVRTRIAELPQN